MDTCSAVFPLSQLRFDEVLSQDNLTEAGAAAWITASFTE